MITTEQFHNYLVHLGLFRIQIGETSNSFEAILSFTDEPDLSDFTQIHKDAYGYPVVRLSKNDIHNEAITKGFFTV
jgi:hypothetical protein